MTFYLAKLRTNNEGYRDTIEFLIRGEHIGKAFYHAETECASTMSQLYADIVAEWEGHPQARRFEHPQWRTSTVERIPRIPEDRLEAKCTVVGFDVPIKASYAINGEKYWPLVVGEQIVHAPAPQQPAGSRR